MRRSITLLVFKPGVYRLFSVVLAAALVSGCATRERIRTESVSQHLEGRRDRPAIESAGIGIEPMPVDAPIATVAGRPIARDRVVDMLLRSYGPGILEQFIVLEAAADLAREKGITISRHDIDLEYERALRRLTDPLFMRTSGTFDRDQAESILMSVLAERNMSHEEFLMGMRRNAYLRQIVTEEMSLTERQIREELERSYGRRVQIRHIQLATLREVARVREQLTAGADFAELARTCSANAVFGPGGGLLEPFSRRDEDVPAALREAAFSLEPDEVSNSIRVGTWYHLIKIEQRLPAGDVDIDEKREELEQRLRERLSGSAVEELYEKLFREADVKIHDPVLRDAFTAQHPDRNSR